MSKKLIVYELNEVPKKIINYYSELYPHSSFKKLISFGNCFDTKTEDFGHLSPWITWPSLHRGVNNTKHEISNLGQNLVKVNLEYPPIWETLSLANIKVGIFGSLHSYPLPKNVNDYSFYVPDTFAAGPECFPSKFSDFQKFNLEMVAKNGRNVNSTINLKSAINFLKACPNLGMTLNTFGKISNQIISERLNKDRLVRRRTSQVQLAFDFFFKELKSTNPDISFFFTNHVASSLHRYWPSIFPNDYEELKFDIEWRNRWKKEIPHTLNEADHQLQKLINFVDQNLEYKLVVVSSMGQAAVQGSEKIENQVLITNIKKLMEYIKISNENWSPHLGMQPLQVVTIKNEEDKKKLSAIKNININGKIISVEKIAKDDYLFSLGLINQKNLNIIDNNNKVDPFVIGIDIVNLQDAAGSNAYHIPEGICIIYDGKNILNNSEVSKWNQISTLEIAPSILNNFSLSKPDYMKQGFSI